jgi:hypothetical protein
MLKRRGKLYIASLRWRWTLKTGASDVVPSSSKKLETSFYFLLIPGLIGESAIPASAKSTKDGYTNLVQPPISTASETAKFIFTPRELPAVANAGKQAFCETSREHGSNIE